MSKLLVEIEVELLEAEKRSERLREENERLRLAHEEITDLPNRTGVGWDAADISRAALENNDE